jgi:hypothetical protein
LCLYSGNVLILVFVGIEIGRELIEYLLIFTKFVFGFVIDYLELNRKNSVQCDNVSKYI